MREPRACRSVCAKKASVSGFVCQAFLGEFPEGGLDFLEVAVVWKFPYRIPPKQTSKKFASEPPNF